MHHSKESWLGLRTERCLSELESGGLADGGGLGQLTGLTAGWRRAPRATRRRRPHRRRGGPHPSSSGPHLSSPLRRAARWRELARILDASSVRPIAAVVNVHAPILGRLLPWPGHTRIGDRLRHAQSRHQYRPGGPWRAPARHLGEPLQSLRLGMALGVRLDPGGEIGEISVSSGGQSEHRGGIAGGASLLHPPLDGPERS